MSDPALEPAPAPAEEAPPEPAPAKPRTGACLCGAVKYKLEGKAAVPLWNTVCHCLNCRRRSGSALYTASICALEGFEITEGEDMLSTYEDTMTDSGEPLKRQFCKKCGSNMFNIPPPHLYPGIVSISAGSHDDFEDWTPEYEQYCIHRADWMNKIYGIPPEKRYKGLGGSETETH